MVNISKSYSKKKVKVICTAFAVMVLIKYRLTKITCEGIAFTATLINCMKIEFCGHAKSKSGF